MSKARWFLAHTRMDDDADINHWCSELPGLLAQPGWSTEVTAGRDDYNDRAKSLGGWKAWGRNVPRARTFDGDIMFHGIIVPAGAMDDCPTVGKATAQLVQGFIDLQKHVLVWCPSAKDFRQVEALTKCDEDNFKKWASLKLALPDSDTD